MTMDIRTKRLFSDSTFHSCFSDLFSDSDGLLAPLSYIIKHYPLAVGKGGANYLSKTGEDVPDMSYLTHVLNACIIGGRMFEKDVISNKKDSRLLEKQIRLFFSAMVLHDINKLFAPNEKEAAQRLDLVFDASKDEIIKIVGNYLNIIGSPEKWLNDLKYLIMITEERTRELAGNIDTLFSRQELEEIGRYLKFGDQVSSGTKDTDSLELFHYIKEKFVSFDLYNREEYKNSLHFIKLPDIPQTLLRLKFINALTEELSLSNGRRNIVIRTPDSIIYYGDPIDSNFIEALTDRYKNIINPNSDIRFKELLKSYPPGSNKISFEWARYCGTYPSSLKKWIDEYINLFYDRIFLWSGEEWRKAHLNFPEFCQLNWGIKIEKQEQRRTNGIKFKVKRYDEAPVDPDIIAKQAVVKLAAARRLVLELDTSMDEDSSPEISDLIADADLIQKKTVKALAYAGSWKDKTIEERNSEYERQLEKLSMLISSRYPPNIGTLSEDVNYLLGKTIPDSEDPLAIPDKRYACIQCGRYSKEALTEDRVFGFNPTAGGGKKLTRLVYSEDVNGRICSLCRIENMLRKEEFRDVVEHGNEALTVQIFLGDFIAPVDISTIISSLNEDIKKEIDDNLILRLSAKEKMQLNYHALGFISKPRNSGTVPQICQEFELLKKFLKLISETGFKIHITPLFNSQRILKPIFTWENAPGWVKELRWDSIRIDQVNETLKEIEFLETVSNIGRGQKDVPDVIAARLRGPDGLLNRAWEYYVRKGMKKLTFQHGNARKQFEHFCQIHAEVLNMKEVERMVEAMCKMADKPPETNSEDRWAIQRAFEVYERGVAESWDEDDEINQIAGRIRAEAYRKVGGSGDKKDHQSIIDSESIEFAKAFVELMKKKYRGKIPRSESRRNIEAEFSLLYHIRKWDSNRKAESELSGF
ncbi:MAG: hypothetical protein QXU18_03230 [Thermoplasmatales archaeon]